MKEKDPTKYAALFISVLALATSIFLGSKANEHNELSVSPYLDITYFFPDSEDGGLLTAGIRVDNSGLGPAIIEHMRVRWGEESWNSWDGLYSKIGITDKVNQAFITTFKPGNALRSGRPNLGLFYVKPQSSESSALERAIDDGLLDVQICYRSLYGEFKVSSLQSGVAVVENCATQGF